MHKNNDFHRTAIRLRIAVIGMMMLIALVWLISALDIQPFTNVRFKEHYREAGLPYSQLVAGLTVGLFMIALARLATMLKRIAEGDRFSPAVTRPFRDFALFLLLSSLAALVLPAAAAILSGPSGPLGARELQFRFGLREVIFALASLVLFLVARMLEEAARMEAELREIV